MFLGDQSNLIYIYLYFINTPLNKTSLVFFSDFGIIYFRLLFVYLCGSHVTQKYLKSILQLFPRPLPFINNNSANKILLCKRKGQNTPCNNSPFINLFSPVFPSVIITYPISRKNEDSDFFSFTPPRYYKNQNSYLTSPCKINKHFNLRSSLRSVSPHVPSLSPKSS